MPVRFVLILPEATNVSAHSLPRKYQHLKRYFTSKPRISSARHQINSPINRALLLHYYIMCRKSLLCYFYTFLIKKKAQKTT